MENILSDKIDQYLDGKLNAADKTAFEKEISANETLRRQVEDQKNLRQGIERMQVKANISSTYKTMKVKGRLTRWGLTTVAIAAVGTAAYFGLKEMKKSGEAYELPTLNEQGTKEWADADKNLPTQLFTINPDKDTVLETDGGIIFAVPAGAFLNAKEPLTIEVREALNATDIIKGGLSTTSDGQLLETGGMFYINGRNGETSLKLNPDKPLYANVPTNEIKPGMQLFEGERKADGSINWKNPKKLEKQLVQVDIHSLDFYPKGFREKCAELGFDANNKKVTDSIYYSYAGRGNAGNLETLNNISQTESDSETSYLQIVVAYKGSQEFIGRPNVSRTKTQAKERADSILQIIQSGKAEMLNLMEKLSDAKNSAVMKMNYKVGRKTSGPAQIIENEFGYNILQFFDMREKKRTLPYEINPARISAIWNDKFQNTIIATKEFEERLQVIFKLGRPKILDLYINNLDKKMYEIDSMAVFGGPESSFPQFEIFYKRHDGGIAISQPHMKKLQEYFNTQRKAQEMAAQKTYDDRMAKNSAADQNHQKITTDQTVNDSKHNSENFAREFDVNLTEAYRQLGIERPKFVASSGQQYYGVPVANTGWHNVDRYVFEATLNRTTLDYTDPDSGKKAIIKYEPFSVTVDNETNYEQLKVYLLADSLNSFMRVSKSGNVYSEKLNELFKYTLVVVGQKDKKWFWVQKSNIKSENISVSLNEIEESQLRVNLDYSFTRKAGNDFRNDLDAMIEQHYYTIQLQERKKQEEIDNAIMPVIFPFWQPAKSIEVPDDRAKK